MTVDQAVTVQMSVLFRPFLLTIAGKGREHVMEGTSAGMWVRMQADDNIREARPY